MPSNVTTLDVSGCTGLTSLTVPSNVTTLDVSGCTGLTSLTVPSSVTTLDVSGCTGLTSLTVPSNVTTLDVSGCTGLTSLTVPSSVTTLDVSGCTGLTSLTMPSSVTTLNASDTNITNLDLSDCTGLTTLNVSGCTGLTTLDLSENTSLTVIDVSNNDLLTALKLPASVTSLNVAECSSLVIYFDGTSEHLNIPETASVVCWGDYTYTIAKGGSVTLGDIFSSCGITAIGENDVNAIVASDNELLQVNGLTVTNQRSFANPQTLTITLNNGMSGAITVLCATVKESDNLNEFLDANTVYSYEGEENTHPLTEPAILQQNDKLNLTLSFSEIPEGQEGERQMKLLAPMTYTFPAGLTVDKASLPETVNISVKSGEDTYSFDAAVSFNSGTHMLTVTVDYGNQGNVVSADANVSFAVPVTVQASNGDYAFGNNLTLSVVSPHNVKVSSLTSQYDATSGNIQYTVTVEAESDLDNNGKEYPVVIKDLTFGNELPSGPSGSFTYAHKEGFALPEGASPSKVNGNAVDGTATAFTGFPLTVEHMYEGDVITLTYTAKPLTGKGTYNKETHLAQVENTVTITNNDSSGKPNPSNNTGDDTASCITENIPYTLLTREYLQLDGSWAYWRVTVNPGGYTISGNNPLTLKDTFDDGFLGDASQSIDYASIQVSTNTVTYDYSGSTGTFVIPDSTPVTITYRTRITAQPGQAALFRGTARLFDSGTDPIASATAGVTKDAVVIYPSPSDVTGTGNYMVKLYVYADKKMQQGIEGAQFILLDANQRPLEYKLGDNKGKPVTFETGPDGYVNIELHEEAGDVSIEKNTAYYLEMMQAVPGYQKDNTLYSFMITDDPNYNTGGFYLYYNGDTMKVRLYPSAPGLSVSIRFSGSYALREDQQNNVAAVLQKRNDKTQSWDEVERHPYTDSQWGSITFSEVLYNPDLGEFQNLYRVVEENQNPWDLPDTIHSETTYYSMVNTEPSDPHNDPQEFSVDSADDSVSVVIDNRYEEPQLTLIKMDKATGEVLPGAEFTVKKAHDNSVVTTYRTDSEGKIVIAGGDTYQSEILYYVVETEAPDYTDDDGPKYLLPLEEERHYFYFCNDDILIPSILEDLPEGETAINLTESGDRITIDNQKEKITIPVMKLWQGEQWPQDAEVVVGLYTKKTVPVIGKIELVTEMVPVYEADGETPRRVVLTKTKPYDNTAFTDLDSRDEQDRNINYAIKEETITFKDQAPQEPLSAGYVQEYGVSSAGVYIVRNKPAATLTVSKEWYRYNPDTGADEKVENETELAAQSSVTFDVYRSSTKFTDTIPDDGITNADMTAFVSNLEKVRENQSFGASDNWTKSIEDLDKQDDLNNPYYYYILETVPSFCDELYEVNETAGTVTIKNKIAPDTVNLTVQKAPLVDDPREESLDRDFEFTLKLSTSAGDHPIRSWKVYTDTNNPENNLITDWNGEVKFTLKPTNPDPDRQPTPGASITLSLPQGVTATVTETAHPEYTVATSATVSGGTSTDNNGRTFSCDTSNIQIGDAGDTLTYTNTLRVICKVVKDDQSLSDEERQIPFESLKSALKYIRDNPSSFSSPWTIYMLEDYNIPVTDGIDLAEGESLTLTTASTTDELFPFKGGEESDRAVITRHAVGGSMITNAGTLTLENICLDGYRDHRITATGNGGLVNSTGTLNLNAGTTLRNSATDGKGGAIYATGTVNIEDGVSITNNSAPSASALYLNGTLNMTGGAITDNTGAADGAVVVEKSEDRINLSGGPVIFDNTNDNTNAPKAANLYIGADSDNVVNVIAPGLSETAKIGVTAMEGHMGIGEQFATAEFGRTENLSRFINDAYGYHGKLKDGTSTNIVWDGLTFTITKAVDSVGANPNDRFTITLVSKAIVMSTYIINGTLDYEVTPAWQNRPGRIVLSNVTANDVITISPLPVGAYTITEAEPNYAPSYTISETGSTATPTQIGDDGKFDAENDSTITVTNTRKLAVVKLTKTLDDRLAGGAPVDFSFTVKLTEADGTAVEGFTLAEGITTDESGVASFTMSPTDADDFEKNLNAPVGTIMTITETDNPNYRITASAKTMPAESEEGESITDEDTDNDNIFAFNVTDDGANVTFANVRKMAEIELRKNLVGKVSKTESFTYTLTLTNGTTPVANYLVYKDEENPENNIQTNESGVATVTLTFGENETGPKSIPLTIPEGTKLVVAETVVKKTIGNAEQAIYNTNYSINGAAARTGATATITKVSDSDHSIVFTNTRKMNTIVVKNTVTGYAGNDTPFTYTATVTDDEENHNDDYDLNGFTDGVMSFTLTTGQTQTLTVPYGATVNISETFIPGYDTTVKRGSAAAVTALGDKFVVSGNVNPLSFTNTQLIKMQLVNNTSSPLENVQVYNDYGGKTYRINSDQTGQDELDKTDNWVTVDRIEAGETVILAFSHNTKQLEYSQTYYVKSVVSTDDPPVGGTPADGYYYTILNEPSFHEYANPAVLRVYNRSAYQVEGKLRYSVADSTVTFNEQPLVSFDANGGVWTTEMEGYHDRDGDRQVYQIPVDSGEMVTRPDPDPVYSTAEEVHFLGWSENASAENLYNFETTAVSAPLTLYAVWDKEQSEQHTVTVKNGFADQLTVTATLMQSNNPVPNHNFAEGIVTSDSGQATFTLEANATKNLSVPDGATLALAVDESHSNALSVSSEFTNASTVPQSFLISSVMRDGTVSFIGGIFKITDADGNLLYDANGKPAVYGKLRKKNNTDPDEAFDAYVKTLYSDAAHTTTATPAAVKQLVDEYTIQETAAIAFPNAAMTLTSAGKDDTDFPYVGVRDRGTIYRSAAGANNNCFTLASGDITLTNIILDGGSGNGVKIAKTANGGLIFMNNASGTLNVTTGTTLRNCEFAVYDDGNNSRGGAIYMTNGTLNVDAGLFSNLHARQGGAICVYGGTPNITGTKGSTQFEDCRSEMQDGGAIYYNRAQDLVINGGEDKANPGIIFTRCVAAYTNGTGDGSDGGAIFATSDYKNNVTVKGCAFIECSARTNNNASTSGYGGGAINGYKVKGLTVEACTFESCDTLCGGGAVAATVKYTETVNNEAVTIKNCSFDQCNCKSQGGALAVYQDNNKATNSVTKLSIIKSSFTGCSSGTNNGSGGAIQCYLPCMVFSDSSFTDCWAGKEGGAVNNFFQEKYGEMWPKSSLTVEECTFTRCRAEDRYQPEQMQHYGGAINTKVMTVTVTGSRFEDCVSTLREGGALHLGGIGTDSAATITGSTFKNCSAKTSGGAVMASTATLTVSDSFFYGCQAFGMPESNYKYDNANKKNQNGGGAISHSENSRNTSTQVTTSITNCVFTADPQGGEEAQSCSTATDGGAIWTRAGSVEINGCIIDGCTATQGGGIYLKKVSAQTATISSIINDDDEQVGSITNCHAVSGSAVYVEDKATFSGSLNVSDNTVSDINSGAIHGGTLYFEGNVVVEDNTCSADSTDDHDVLMQNDNVTTIYTTSVGLEREAHIGVYVPDTYFDAHGTEGTAFGTWTAESGNTYLDAFFNDRDSELFGCQLGEDDYKIYWSIYVCKITDADGNTLKRTNGRDAIYRSLSDALGEFTTVTDENNPNVKPVYIKMLVESYSVKSESAISSFPAADVTLTTAARSDEDHPYRGTADTVCTIFRTDEGGNALFQLNNTEKDVDNNPLAKFRLENITLDGRRNKTGSEGNYQLIQALNGALFINPGTTLQYGTANNGGAVYATNADVTVNIVTENNTAAASVQFLHCTATENGGAICANNLTIQNGGTGKNGTVFSDCTAASGGAICSVGELSIEGATFQNCTSTYEGGAVYHNAANNNASIQNSAFENCSAQGAAQGDDNARSSGGAVNSKAETLTVSACEFYNCFALSNGGAIDHSTGGTDPNQTTITDTTFRSCQTTGTDTYGFGGSVYTQAVKVEVQGSSFNNSTAKNHGGALYCQSSAYNSTVTISGSTGFNNCSATGNGGAIYNKTMALTVSGSTTINACKATVRSGAIYMATGGSTLTVTGSPVISSCYAGKGGAIYLPVNVTMNLSGSPEFTMNGYTRLDGEVVEAMEGACIYLEEGSRLNLSGSPSFSRNILPNSERITNGGIYDNVRQDIYLAGYWSNTAFDKNAASIYVVGELTGDTIWVWPEKSPHRKPNEQFAKIGEGVTVGDDTLSKLRNALADSETNCSNGEYLAGVKVGTDSVNVYWDKMYVVSFNKIDNKAVYVPDAGFTLYSDISCNDEYVVATATSADGENDKDAQGKTLPKGKVEFTSIRIGAYYMKETEVPNSFKENDTIYLVLVGTPYLSRNEDNKELWDDGPLNVDNAETLVARTTTNVNKYYGIFPLNNDKKADLRANLAGYNVGIVNIRSDYQVYFMKVDGNNDPLPGAAFTIYTQIGNEPLPDGYPKLMRWTRDGETYPKPVESADGTGKFKDVENRKLPKGMVYFPELPVGTYYLLETEYPERNGSNRHAFYVESDRVFKLEIWLPEGATNIEFSLSEWQQPTAETGNDQEVQQDDQYEPVAKRSFTFDENYAYSGTRDCYVVSNEEAVCKLTTNGSVTNSRDKLLYVQGHKVFEDRNDSEGSSRLFPAVYHRLEDGFAAAQTGSFVYGDGSPVDDNAIKDLKLQALKDLTLEEKVEYNKDKRDLTFTTASRDATQSEDPTLSDRYVFSTNRTRDVARAEIKRGPNIESDDALITVSNGASLTLEQINLNGQQSQGYSGRAVYVTGNKPADVTDNSETRSSSLTIGVKALLHNFKTVDSHGGGAIYMADNTKLAINGGYNRAAEFTDNVAVGTEDAKLNGGAIALGSNCNVSIENAQFKSNHADGGGAISVSNIPLTIHNAVFTENTASKYGGAVSVAPAGNLTLDNVTLQNNSAGSRGGAVYLAGQSSEDPPAVASLIVKSGTIKGNSVNNTDGHGGAIYGGASANVTIEGGSLQSNAAQMGGAIYGGASANVTVTGGSLQSNAAQLGSAVYGKDGSTITVTGGSITGNRASDANGGAINVGGSNARIVFGNSPLVFDNFGSATNDTQQRNVVLNYDSNGIINTTVDGLTGGLIGVYVTDDDSGNQFRKHGLYDQPFGTFVDSGKANPAVFRNDRVLALYGTSRDNGNLIYWNPVICKLTNTSDALLYQEIEIPVVGTTKTYTCKSPAVYPEIQEGFNAAQGKLYAQNGSNYPGNALKLKMLKDAELTGSIAYSGSRSVVFTTAETVEHQGDYFVFSTDRQNPDGKALLTRSGFDNASLITVAGKNLTLTDITLDGAKASYTVAANGGIANVLNGGKLTIQDGAALQNSGIAANYSGGAVYVSSGGVVTMTGGVVNHNESAGDGAGIYLAEGGTLNLSGNPSFGGTGRGEGDVITYDNGNFKDDALTDAQNGGKTYTKARQDIYIAGYEGDDDTDTSAASLVITGTITSGDGTIWVWAAESPHYKTLCQFAKYNTSGVTDPAGTLKVFRNARVDSDTGADQVGEYLYGVPKENGNVFWYGVEGTAHVILVKVQLVGKNEDEGIAGKYQPLPARTFTVYTDEAMNNVAKWTPTNEDGTPGEPVELSGLTSGAGGAFFIGDLSYGDYYVKEWKDGTEVGHFKITVDENGVTDIGKNSTSNPHKVVQLD